MLFKKTNIVLAKRNFAVLMLAIGVLKEQFDKHAVPVYSTIRGKDSLYEVTIGFDVDRIGGRFNHAIQKSHYEIVVIFSISSEPYQLDGKVQLIAAEGPANFRFNRPEGLIFYYKNGICNVPQDTTNIIVEYFTRIKEYLPLCSGYPVR